MLTNNNYNPDVLSCLANLSSDEVFTPPQLVNKILDLLPEEIWSDKNARFLDPVCKTGVFLREIARRMESILFAQNLKTKMVIFALKVLSIPGKTASAGFAAQAKLIISEALNSKHTLTSLFIQKIHRRYLI